MSVASARMWPDNGGIYRGVHSLNTAWEASPVIPDAPDRFDGFPWDPALVREESDQERESRLGRNPRAKKPPCGSFWRGLRKLFKGDPDYDNAVNMGLGCPPVVPVHFWKAYGYWARPTINHVQVNNTTPRPFTSRNVNPAMVFNSLVSPDGTPHPERWIPGIQHPSLPPRPNLPGWRTPQPGSMSPLPGKCALNPFLVHSPAGRPAVTFDMGVHPLGICYSETGPNTTIPLAESDRAQPATYPLVTEMHILHVADDPEPQFPWPVTVENQRGVTVQDVFDTLYYNFSAHVSSTEYNSWDERRQQQVGQAYWTRINQLQTLGRRDDSEGGLKRIDYLRDRVMFRGLEPAPSRGNAWMLFIGPS